MKRLVLGVLALVLVVGGVAVWALNRPPERAARRADPTPSPTASATAVAEPEAVRRRQACSHTRKPFDPTAITVAGVARRVPVIDPPRDANGVPGVPPLTSAGAHVFAWDRAQGTRPGDRHGNILLNAHTWPDGSALGNRLLSGLHEGDRVVVRGADARLCYRVTERIEVPAVDGFPAYYAKNGPSQLAIIVCSGRRLGPGEWENRTIWFAAPKA